MVSPPALPHAAVYLGDNQAFAKRIQNAFAKEGFALAVLDRYQAATDAAPFASVAAMMMTPEPGRLSAAIRDLSSMRSRYGARGFILLSDEWNRALRIEAIRSGCDYCMETDIDADELAVVALALARKEHSVLVDVTVRSGPIRVDFIRGNATVGTEVIEPQPLQLRILGLLTANAGKMVTHEQLMHSVFRAPPASVGSLARHISVLRHQLGRARTLLVTMPGGYCLEGCSVGSDELREAPISASSAAITRAQP
jgi:DNA-binding response OmpR family regulator